MILYLIDDLIINGDETTSKEYRDYKHCIRNIANTVIEGNHILRGDYNILCRCIEMFKGDSEYEMFFRDLVNNYATNTIPSDITYYIEVVKNNPQEREENGRVIAQRCINDFYNSSTLYKSKLICEDENDCSFYKFVAEWYIKKEGLKYHLNIAEVGGGGARTINKIKDSLFKEKQLCICIVDTDKKYPQMAISPHSKDCQKLDNHKCGYRCIVINVHEIENILPLNYIDDLIETNQRYNYKLSKEQKKHFDYLRYSNEVEDILPYFDYKNGIKNNEEYIKSADYQKYAKLCWQQNPEINKDCTFNEYVNKIEKDKHIYKQLSRTIAADILEYISDNKNALKEPDLLKFQEKEWIRIGKELVNWGCARVPEGIS
ncbi:MAG: hypothetical protein J6M59_05030 [Bacteroidaceae bacterium]|nr:hypothetical protein [Bacteroidaceae bacterium]